MQVRPLPITLILLNCLRISCMERQRALLVQMHMLFSEPEDLHPGGHGTPLKSESGRGVPQYSPPRCQKVL